MTQMKVQSVRFGDYQWSAIHRAADAEGVTTAQFVRETAFARAVLVLYLAGDERVVFANSLVRALDSHPELAQSLRDMLTRQPSTSVHVTGELSSSGS